MKLNSNQIILNANVTTKDQLFDLIATVAHDLKIITSKVKLKHGLQAREQQGSTGMEHGFAIPHAKIDDIKKPAILVLKSQHVIVDYDALDKSKIDYAIALLIPNKGAANVHMQMLSAVALKLNDAHFRTLLRQARTKKAIIKLFDAVAISTHKVVAPTIKNGNMKIVGVTSCAAGIAHTYIARDNLIQAGATKGYNMRIETQGAVGPETALTHAEIASADVVLIASDIDVDLQRFKGKKLFRGSVHPAVKDAAAFLDKAISKAKIYQTASPINVVASDGHKQKFLSHIMNGISWMIPLLVAAAIFIAIPSISGAFVGESEIVTSGDWKQMVAQGLDNAYWKFMYLMIKIGWISISLMFPIFAAFTAFSIGHKPAFIPGLIGGFLAKPELLYKGAYAAWFHNGYPFLDKTSGFWGALLIGIAIGYIIKYANQWIKLPAIIASMKPMLILPMIGVISVVMLMVLAINPVFGLLNEQLITLAKQIGQEGKYVLALIIAPMTASDLGGPINKAAVTTMYNFYDAKTFSLTMRVIPTITPSIGLGIAAMTDRLIVRRRVFDDDVRKAAPNAIILALLGISEGGLPFVFKKPLVTIPLNMLGGLIGAYVGIMTNTEQWFPDSAIWAWPFAKPVWGMLLGISAGSIATALLHIYCRYLLMSMNKIKIDAEYNRLRNIGI